MWQKIRCEDEIKLFLNEVNYLHDSCIKELKYTSGAYVDEQLAMYPINDKRTLCMILQLQNKNYKAIELEFVGVERFQLAPVSPNFTCEILGVTMYLKDDNIYWFDDINIISPNITNYNGTAICARHARWRISNRFIGSQDVYVQRDGSLDNASDGASMID